MKFRIRSLYLLGLFSLLGLSVVRTGLASPNPVSMEPDSPVKIWIDFPLDDGKPYGNVPIIVTIENRMARDGVWDLETEFSSGYYNNNKVRNSRFTLAVPAGQTQSFSLSAPMANLIYTAGHSYHYPVDFRTSFSGPYSRGIREFHSLYNQPSSGVSFYAFLISEDLWRDYSDVNNTSHHNKKKGQKRRLCRYDDARKLPDDWRTYLRYDSIVMREAEWLSLSKKVREAMLAAVSSGEVELRFLTEGDTLSEELAEQMNVPKKAKVWPVGLGIVSRYVNLAGQDWDRSKAADFPAFSTSSPELPSNLIARPFNPHRYNPEQKSLGQTIEEEKIPVTLISVGIILFGLLIGPINLFVFAKGRNRWRILITTPVIALVASVLLILTITLRDGIGGEGYISRLIVLEPGTGEAYVRQEQYSETGLYFSEPFKVEGEEFLYFRGTDLGAFTHRAESNGRFAFADGLHSGDWFASKRHQKHQLQTFVSSRESIDLIRENGEPAELFSNLRAVCDVIYYVDSDGSLWRARDLRLGGREALEAVDEEDFEKWYAGQCQAAGEDLGEKLKSFGIRKGHYYAGLSDWQQPGLKTSEGIRWKIHSQVLIGQPEQTEGGLSQ